MKNSSLASQAFALATVALWSAAYVYTKVALEHFSPGALGLLRCGVASLAFALVFALGRQRTGNAASGLCPKMQHAPLLALSGLCGFTFYMLAFNWGSTTLNPTTNCIVISTSPIITAVLARVFFGERLRPLRWVALALAFAGVVVMNGGGHGFMLAPGIAWVLLAALLISLYNVLQRKLARHYSAVQITAWSFFAGTFFLLFFLPDAATQLRSASFDALAVVVFLGVFPSAAAYLFWARALALAPRTSLVTNYMFLTPFLSLLLEYVVTGGLPEASTFAGGGVILASLLLFSLAGQRPDGGLQPLAPQDKKDCNSR